MAAAATATTPVACVYHLHSFVLRYFACKRIAINIFVSLSSYIVGVVVVVLHHSIPVPPLHTQRTLAERMWSTGKIVNHAQTNTNASPSFQMFFFVQPGTISLSSWYPLLLLLRPDIYENVRCTHYVSQVYSAR